MDFRRIFLRRTPEEKFWRWFYPNSYRILSTRTGPMEMKRAVNRYDRALIWSIETDPVTEVKCLTFRVRLSMPEKVPVVQRLVAAAPKMDEWRFRAFEPPKPLGPASHGYITLVPEDVYFSACEDPDGVRQGIRLYVTDLDHRDPHSPQGEAAFQMLFDFLGELDAITKLRIVSVHSMAEIDGNQRPLRDLPLLLDGKA